MRASFATHGKEHTERILIFLFSASMHFRKQYLTAKIHADKTRKVQRYLFATPESRILKSLKLLSIQFLWEAFQNYYLFNIGQIFNFLTFSELKQLMRNKYIKM